MHEEAFIRAILADPKDDVARQVYADWLEEQGDSTAAAKAEYLRVTVQLASKSVSDRSVELEMLRWLAARLDKTWLAIVSSLAIENCLGEGQEPGRRFPLRFDYVCERRWEDLKTGADPKVRLCEGCSQTVHYCASIAEARVHADVGHCVAVDLSVPRRKGDLESPRLMAGIVSSADMPDF